MINLENAKSFDLVQKHEKTMIDIINFGNYVNQKQGSFVAKKRKKQLNGLKLLQRE